MHDQLLMRVFSARDYEEHENDAAILSISKGKQRLLECSGKYKKFLLGVSKGCQHVDEKSLE